MKPRFIIFFLLLSYYSQNSFSQEPFRVVWYNVENLFDTIDNPHTEDDEFTPSGKRRWTVLRYNYKLKQLAKVIETIAEEEVPVLIGLCEVENDGVLIDLLNQPALQSYPYSYCLAETDDVRGIRVALLYQPNRFNCISHTSIPVPMPDSTERGTRHLLHVWGNVTMTDTLDILLAHFPSRYEGVRKTEPRRLQAASILKSVADSVCLKRTNPRLLIMGDLNDYPTNKSILEVLAAKPVLPDAFDYQNMKWDSSQLYNMIPFSVIEEVKGTYKYRGKWNQLDYLIINGAFLNNQSAFYLQKNRVEIFSPSFLFTKDESKAGGIRPKRSYHGFRYESGYSDHLPIIADFLLYLPD